MKQKFLTICIFILIMLTIIIGFYKYESYKLNKENNNIITYIDKYSKLNEEIEQYKILLNDISLLNLDTNELNLKVNDLKEEVALLEEEITIINNKITQIS